jgi:hypothetical protein
MTGIRDGREDSVGDRIANAVEVATANVPGLKGSDGDGVLDTSEGAGRIVAVKTMTDECPAGTPAPGAWVHEVTVSRSAEAGVEFEELLVVK